MAGRPEPFDQFYEDVGNGTVFEVVLRGHLWVESELLRSLEAALPFPALAELDRIAFGHKVALVAAHGLMKPDERSGFQRLNLMRNRLAHRLDGEFTERDESDLLNALGARHRANVDLVVTSGTPSTFPNRLRIAVTAMCVQLQIDRDTHQQAHERLRRSAQRLVDLADQRGAPNDD